MKRVCQSCQKTVEPVVTARHLVMCGDSTSEEDVGRLMGEVVAEAAITDPPYNVGESYEGAYEGRDEKSEEEYQRFCEAFLTVAKKFSKLQVITPGFNNLPMWCALEKPRHVAAWTKLNAMTRGSVSRFSCWEPILFYGESIPRERANDVFNYAAGMHADTGGHPCPKSVKLWEDLVSSYTTEGGRCLTSSAGAGRR